MLCGQFASAASNPWYTRRASGDSSAQFGSFVSPRSRDLFSGIFGPLLPLLTLYLRWYPPTVRSHFTVYPTLETLLIVFLLGLCSGCRSTSFPEEVSEHSSLVTTEEQLSAPQRIPGVDPDTLWRLEAQYLGANGEVLSTTRFEVVYVLGQWRSEPAPLQISTGYIGFRDPGEFGDGAPDLLSALQVAPSPLTMRISQRVVPFNETQPIVVPAGATALHARLLQVCSLKVRRMRQFHWRPTGDVIAIRHVKEEMRWREYLISGPCRTF